MKTIGLIGGMSWESTAHYYAELNRGIKKNLGGLHSAKILLYSLDFGPIEALQQQGDWHRLGAIMADAAQRLEKSGADCILICTNTMHKLADEVEEAVDIPLIHIADATAQALVQNGIKKAGLLGTAYTMEQTFYKQRLIDKFDLDILIPNEPGRATINRIIYEELCLGKILPESKKAYIDVANRLIEDGVQAIILGCTEIGMLLKQTDIDIFLYDTTLIHAQKAVEWVL
ncbi:MAG: aspartate/glutamate racemase family protein [Desulfobacula sp.]|nr:aspartate/glutamate racemase family protein [Desulfobacula sp.]